LTQKVLIVPFKPFGEDFEELRAEAASERYNFIENMKHRWDDGSDQYLKRGEMLLALRDNSSLIAIGGLNRDPYLEDRAGRIRHVYVRTPFRGQNWGRTLILHLIDAARPNFPYLRLRAADDAASIFYDRLGFERVEEETATHRLEF